MKHLHLQFIAASCGLGFGVFMLLLAVWQAQALNIVGPATVNNVAPLLDIFVGIVLIAFGLTGIHQEISSYRRS